MRIVLGLVLSISTAVASGCGDDDDDGAAGSGGSGDGKTDAEAAIDGGSTESVEDASAIVDAVVEDGGGMVFDLSVELDYSDNALWMCKPGIADNACDLDLDATAILPDGSVGEVKPHETSAAPDFDCFYLYPTADFTFEAGNVTDLSANRAPKNFAVEQAARFNGLCRVFAPYYRQMTIGSYTNSPVEKYEEVFEKAYRDVINAFRYYMDHDNQGRDIVLMGHSQGAHMLTRLLQEEFDEVAEMRGRLLSALLIGTTDIYVPHGETVGGSFQNIPICTRVDQVGCIVSCNLITEPVESVLLPGGPYTSGPPEGNDVICVHPGAPGGGKAPLGEVYSPAIDADVTTPYVAYRDLYAAECIGEGKARGLLVEDDPDNDIQPIDFKTSASLFFGSETSLHIIEYKLILGELLELVKAQAESR